MHLKSLFCEKKAVTMMTVFFVVLMLCFSGMLTAQVKKQDRLKTVKAKELKRALTLEKAKEVMVKKVYRGKLGKRALFANPVLKRAGAKIASWRVPNKVTVDKDSWFFFVDEQPEANWEHKASYVIVNKTTGAVKRVAAMSPPKEMLKLKALNRKASNQMSVLKDNVHLIRTKMVLVPGILKLFKRSRYAVLVSGGYNPTYNYARYWNDLKFIYTALKKKYKFTDNEIIVLYANGTHSPNADLDGDGTNDIDYAATKANLKKAIAHVATYISLKGKFFFYATNHGGDDPGDYKSNLTLWHDSIKDYEFAALTKKIKCANAIYVMEQCFSGGMTDDLLKAQTYPCTSPRVCVMTAARHDESSWACDTEGQYDEYVYHWTSAIYGKTPSGSPVNADTDGNGSISMKEAHEYAKKKDSRSEHPGIGSCVTGACNTTLKAPLMMLKPIKMKKVK